VNGHVRVHENDREIQSGFLQVIRNRNLYTSLDLH
jgi:hypothetical protein